ncbi:MAG: autotransporter-associated beta strand repeat-containing protein [Chthoniobacter sp.]
MIRGQTMSTSVVTGNITISAGTLRLDQIASSTANFQGGVLDIEGNISGAGVLMTGNENNTTTNINADSNSLGVVRLSGNNTYTGGTTLRAGRLQIASNTALGTGAINFGPAGYGDQGAIEAYGADRTITNTLNAISWNGNTVLQFAGHNNLTFTSNLNLSSENTAGRSRTFNISMTQGVTTFSGNLSVSAANGVSFVKTGVGTLVLNRHQHAGAVGHHRWQLRYRHLRQFRYLKRQFQCRPGLHRDAGRSRSASSRPGRCPPGRAAPCKSRRASPLRASLSSPPPAASM